MKRGGPFRGLRSGTLLLALTVACTTPRDAPPTQDRQTQPGDYRTVVDTGRSDPGHFVVTHQEDYLDVMTGPGGITWRPEDAVGDGDFLAEATLTVIGAPVGYREGFGVFVGGTNLDGPGTRYTYLLVRPAGDFMIARRRAATIDTLVAWTPQATIRKVTDDREEPTNVVGILTVGDEVRFLVNGTVVHRMPAAEVAPYGLAGLRVNHRVDVHVPSWYLGAPPLGTGS